MGLAQGSLRAPFDLERLRHERTNGFAKGGPVGESNGGGGGSRSARIREFVRNLSKSIRQIGETGSKALVQVQNRYSGSGDLYTNICIITESRACRTSRSSGSEVHGVIFVPSQAWFGAWRAFSSDAFSRTWNLMTGSPCR